MASIDVQIDDSALADLVHDSALPELVRDGNRLLSAAKNLCPVDTGYLRSTIGMDLDPDELTCEVYAGAEYAEFVHDGTRPHVIYPRRARVLRWPGPGGYIYARRVNHPGTRAQPFLTDALNSL